MNLEPFKYEIRTMQTIPPMFKEKIDGLEIEFTPIQFNNEDDCQIKINEIDQILDSFSGKILTLDAEIDKLTNHADAFDYTVAVASGVLTGLIDSFWVGEIDWAEAKADAHKTINKFIEVISKVFNLGG